MARPAYRTRAYRHAVAYLRANVVACVWCGARATTPDHLVPVALGGGDDDLVPSCQPCNEKRGRALAGAMSRTRARARPGTGRSANTPTPSRSW